MSGLLFTAAFALSEDVREATLNVLIEVMDDHTQITVEDTYSGPTDTSAETNSGLEYHYNIALEWIPEGFELDSGNFDEDSSSGYVSYLSPQDGMIVVSVTPYSAGLVVSFDTEDCTKRDTPMKSCIKPHVVLVAFYNRKALGVRYLESALEHAGYGVTTIFYKDFNSVHPHPTTDQEVELFLQVVRERKPVFVGLSVMSSMYLDTVYQLMDGLRQEKIAPMVCGGAFATMFPNKLLEHGADYVIRSDGEHAICRLADALQLGYDWRSIPSLCWQENGTVHQNEIGDVLNDVDDYGIPVVNSTGACFIDHDTITWGNPQLNTRSYEVIASRGCPFTCSYRNSVQLTGEFAVAQYD